MSLRIEWGSEIKTLSRKNSRLMITSQFRGAITKTLKSITIEYFLLKLQHVCLNDEIYSPPTTLQLHTIRTPPKQELRKCYPRSYLLFYCDL